MKVNDILHCVCHLKGGHSALGILLMYFKEVILVIVNINLYCKWYIISSNYRLLRLFCFKLPLSRKKNHSSESFILIAVYFPCNSVTFYLDKDVMFNAIRLRLYYICKCVTLQERWDIRKFLPVGTNICPDDKKYNVVKLLLHGESLAYLRRAISYYGKSHNLKHKSCSKR